MLMSRKRRSRSARVMRGALWALAVGHVVETALVWNRRRQLEDLDPGAPDAEAAEVEVLATGEGPDEAVVEAAAALMAAESLEIVDLVPGDLDPDRFVRVLRWLDF